MKIHPLKIIYKIKHVFLSSILPRMLLLSMKRFLLQEKQGNKNYPPPLPLKEMIIGWLDQQALDSDYELWLF